MSDLFLKKTKKEIIKHGEKKLQQDPTSWASEIIAYAIEQNPFLADYNLSIHYKKIKEDEGYAIGSIKIKKHDIDLPFVIKKYELYPIDIFIQNNKWHYLTKNNFGIVTNNTALIRDLSSEKNDENNANMAMPMNIPQLDNFFANTFLYKTGSENQISVKDFFDKVASSLTQEEVKEIKKFFGSDKYDKLAEYHQNNLSKIANFLIQKKAFPKFSETKENFISKLAGCMDVIMFEKTGYDSFNMQYKRENNNLSEKIKIDSNDFVVFFDKIGKEKFNYCAKKCDNKEYFIMTRKKDAVKTAASGINKNLKNLGKIKDCGFSYIVKTSSGDEKVSFFPTIIDFDNKVVENKKICMNKHGYEMSDVFYGIKNTPVDRKKEFKKLAATGDIKKVNFIKIGELITTPFKIEHTVVNEQEKTATYYCSNKYGEDFILTPGDVKCFVKTADNKYIIPKKSEILECQDKTFNTIKDPIEFKKIARADENIKYTKVTYDKHSGSFSIGTPELKNNYYSEIECMYELCGMNKQAAEAEKILETAKITGSIIVSDLKQKKDYMEFRKHAEDIYGALDIFSKKIKINLFKEASQLSNKEDVMNVLSLNFVKPEILDFYFKNISNFETTLSNLVQLLMYARMGTDEIDPQHVKKTVINLQKVIYDLKSLKLTNNEVE